MSGRVPSALIISIMVDVLLVLDDHITFKMRTMRRVCCFIHSSVFLRFFNNVVLIMLFSNVLLFINVGFAVGSHICAVIRGVCQGHLHICILLLSYLMTSVCDVFKLYYFLMIDRLLYF